MTLTVGSLFSGIGGLDLGLERAGMQVIWQSEIDPYACRVLKKHWPEVVNHGDIKRIQWGDVVRPDIICGGYPCQPFSTAGKRNGTDDPRHLWPWVLTAISELRPRYAILENVRGHLSLGGLSVIGDLAAIGYDTEWRIISAASVGANHRRDRLIIVAYPHNTRGGTPQCETNRDGKATIEKREIVSRDGLSRCRTNVADTDGERLQRPFRTVFTWPSDGLAYGGGQWWETEPDVGRVAHGIPSRVDRLRGLGNAVVPQVAEVIGRMVVAHAQTI
jgi:DNA (cytosine-5)-methyltransferase 1